MELKEFIGKSVVHTTTKRRFHLREITAPQIVVIAAEPNNLGYRPCYAYNTVNADPFSAGILVFEDASLTQPFKAAYDAYCRTGEAYWEVFGYWMRRD